MIVGCYSMDLYCDGCNMGHGPNERNRITYTGHTEGECFRNARQEGWRLTRNHPREAYCPKCSGKKRHGTK